VLSGATKKCIKKKNRDHSKLLCFMAAENVLEVIFLKEGVNALVTKASAASRRHSEAACVV
jgi:hypothetical protein